MKSSHEVRRGRWRDWIVCFGSCFVLFFINCWQAWGVSQKGFGTFTLGEQKCIFSKNILRTF